MNSTNDLSAYDFHSSEFDTCDTLSEVDDRPKKKLKRKPTPKSVKKSKGPLEDLSELRRNKQNPAMMFDNYERTVILMAMAAAKANLGVDLDNNGADVFRETCKVLDQYDDMYPISKTINPRNLTTIWNAFKRAGHVYVENLEPRYLFKKDERPVLPANYLDRRGFLYK